MKIRELITKLQECDPERIVRIIVEDGRFETFNATDISGNTIKDLGYIYIIGEYREYKKYV
jgi:hypothetical protein